MPCLSATLTKAVFVHLCICVFVNLHVKHSETLILRSSHHCIFINIAHDMSICIFTEAVFVYLCIFVFVYLRICEFAHQTLRNINFEILIPLHFHKYSTCHVYLHLYQSCICVFLYFCICVFVNLHIRYSGTLILRSSYHCIFINIAHAMSICIMPWNKSKVRKWEILLHEEELMLWENCQSTSLGSIVFKSAKQSGLFAQISYLSMGKPSKTFGKPHTKKNKSATKISWISTMCH